ncbi:proteasome assembly chaperone family protein [Allokutzneria albata]|uniref:Predicted ATP-dependent carboligase, ATP-grasp superfamily n=1 Tax=Allokutzneria albata TaxID=211114 RepID=A0A1G9VT15_ALLAB|nr:PAC2 family protein [Allokutzneria albata]SDM75348.1 Predicted ATP-dependent carboligase, ATP-grasp superfamily [Allokutzneria albata]
MGLDPEQLVEVDSDVPDLDGAVLLHNLDGFMDAGGAGRVLADHLVDSLESRVIARFDVDALIDYRSRRPAMTYATDHWAAYEAPELVIRLMHDTVGTPFLLLTGPEPDNQWERFTAAVRGLVERWGVRLTVGFHGIPMGAPHTRPLGVTAHATRAELVADYPQVFNRIQVPGSASALLELRLGEAGHDAIGYAAHVPHYLAQSVYPEAGLRLLGAVGSVAALELPERGLREAAARTNEEIERQVAESDEVAEVVRGLERQYDAFTEAVGERSLLAESGERMPTADELGEEFERFLAEQAEGK